MGTGEYTRRSARLGNLGDVRRVELPDLEASSRAAQGLGRSVAGFGRDVARGFGSLIGDLAQLKREKEERELAIDAVEIKKMWRQRMTNAKNGYMLRLGAAAEGMSVEAGEAFENDVIAVAGEKPDEHQEKLRIMLAGQLNSMMGTITTHEVKELKASSIKAADSLVKSDAVDWASGLMTEETIQGAIMNKNHALDLHGEWSDCEKEAFDRDWCESRYADIIQLELLSCAEEKDYDELEAMIKKDPGFFVSHFPSLKAELQIFNKDGIIPDNLKAGLLKNVKKAKMAFVGEMEYDRRRRVEEIKKGFVEKELGLVSRDMPQTAYMQEYEKMGSDPVLRELAPETALKYLETARRMEEAMEKGKADATEESLSRRLTWNLFCQADGRYDAGKIAADQAEIWRDYKTALMAGAISDTFARSFQGRLQKNLTDQEVKAMRSFYAAFGYIGELDGEGRVSAGVQKENEWTRYYVPENPEYPRGHKPTVKGSELFSLGESFLRTMRELGPEAYRPEVMEKVISRIKSEWYFADFERNRRERVQDFIDIQRNFMAKENENAARESGKKNDGKSGRDVHAGAEGAEDKSADGRRDGGK